MEASTLTTAGMKRGDSISFWADVVCDTFVELDCDFPVPDTFHGQIDRLCAGELEFSRVTSSRHVVTRTRAHIARSQRDDFLLSLQTSGRGTISQGGRQAVLEIGDFAIYDTARPYDLRFDDDFSQLVLRLPRGVIARRLSEADRLTAQTVTSGRGMGSLVSTFLRQLHSQLAELDPICLSRAHSSAVDLISAALAEQAGQPVDNSECGVLMRRRVSAYIDRNIADPRLSCEMIASAHAVSARHLRKVFEETTMSVSELIWARRLEQARRDLGDPLHAHVSVTSIGYDVGFKDAAHFSRAFKSAFGETPSAFRLSARRRLDAAREVRSAANKLCDR